VGEVEQPPVAGGIGGHNQLPEKATDGGDRRCRQGVAVGVDADDSIHPVGQHGAASQAA
jgi:hypothetical protein